MNRRTPNNRTSTLRRAPAYTRSNHILISLLVLAAIASLLPPEAIAQVSYDIVYVRQPRFGNNTKTVWPEVFHPAKAEPGADLMLLHPDGSEEVLVNCTNCSVTDPFVSFDGQWIYYSLFHDLTDLNSQRWDLPVQGADIFRINVTTRAVQQLTAGGFSPNTGAGNWDESNPIDPGAGFNRLGYGILNLGPCPLPGGKVAFTSNRNAFEVPKGFTSPTMQLFVMDEDGSNVTAIAPMTISSALHPTILRDGRIMFSTHEAQGVRDRRLWGVWSIYPDGRNWGPIVSAFKRPSAFHFMTQLSDKDIVVTDYYNKNNNGFGSMYRFPVSPPAGTPGFFSAYEDDNPDIERTIGNGTVFPFQMPFTPWGMFAVTPFTHADDNEAPVGSGGARVGKVTHPSAAPGNDLLVVWTPGPANHNRGLSTPAYDGGLYVVPGGDQIWDPGGLVTIKNDPAYNEAWPRAVVPYSAVHGVSEPVELPWLPNDGTLHTELPVGTPYGLVGTSSFYKRESAPGDGLSVFDGLEPFNTTENGVSSNWDSQGADAGKYDNADIWAVRVLAMEANTHRSYGPNSGGGISSRHFENYANERLRILGEIPLRKPDGQGGEILDPEGNPDTSFLAKIPADTPFTFQTLDKNGLVLNMAQTWHQVRPGEMRVDCGGCHAHSQEPLDFAVTEAAKPGYQVWDLSKDTPLVTENAQGAPDIAVDAARAVNVEFFRDIRPVLQRSCISCHTKNDPNPPGKLVLDDYTLDNGLPGDYDRLANHNGSRWGYPAVISSGIYRGLNASRYVRKFQSRRSMLIWKLFGERLDGWTNADHPTESVPGQANTLPSGANPNRADLDFTGTIMPPPGTATPLTMDEKIMFARWIDLGAPINIGELSGNGDFGWFLDDQRPALEVSEPRAGYNAAPVTRFRIGMADAYTGISFSTFSVTASFTVEGRSPGAELADLAAQVDDGIYEILLSQPLPSMAQAHLFVEVADGEGNFTRIDRAFSSEDAPQGTFSLAVGKSGTGSGTILSSPSGINCGADCEQSYASGTIVTLTASADAGSAFNGWSGSPDCTDGVVTMNGAQFCNAAFDQSQGSNSPPSVTIAAPAAGSVFDPGEGVSFAGSAADAEDGTLTSSLSWTSSVDGALGTGGGFSTPLSEGVHLVTASVTDSGGLTGSASVSVTVLADTFVIFQDEFERPNSATVGNQWVEVESSSTSVLEDGAVSFEATDDAGHPIVRHSFADQSAGEIVWTFDLDFVRTGSERTYSVWMQLGKGALMSDSNPHASGVAVNLIWGGPSVGLDNHQGLGYAVNGSVTQVAIASGLHTVSVVADLNAQTYSVDVDGQFAGSVPFENNVSIDTIRVFTDALNMSNFSSRKVDNIVVRTTAPECLVLETLDLANQTITGTTEFEACDSISAGDNFDILAPGDVTLKARGRVELRDGFSVGAGADLTVAIDPTTGG